MHMKQTTHKPTSRRCDNIKWAGWDGMEVDWWWICSVVERERKGERARARGDGAGWSRADRRQLSTIDRESTKYLT